MLGVLILVGFLGGLLGWLVVDAVRQDRIDRAAEEARREEAIRLILADMVAEDWEPVLRAFRQLGSALAAMVPAANAAAAAFVRLGDEIAASMEREQS